MSAMRTALALLLLLGLAAAGSAQEQSETSESAPAEAEPEQELQRQILGREADPAEQPLTGVLSGARDPFRPVLDVPSGAGATTRRPRPPGIEGMEMGEIALVGIVLIETGNVAFFNGTDNHGYFLRVRDRVYDGKILRIDRDKVVFEQEISGAPGRRTREVVKRLRPIK